MLVAKAEIKPSGLHDVGLFATEPIEAGTVVIKPSSEGLDIELGEDSFKRLDEVEQNYISHYGFKNKYTGKWHLTFDNTRFLNHSTDNANITLDTKTGNLIAKKDIASGEELTQDYSEFEELRQELQ